MTESEKIHAGHYLIHGYDVKQVLLGWSIFDKDEHLHTAVSLEGARAWIAARRRERKGNGEF